MGLDAVCLSAVVDELKKVLIGGKIDKVYQPGRDEMILAIRGAGEHVKLLLSANPSAPRLHLTKHPRENPATPPMFCMLLRKHLVGARILDLHQPHLERIVELKLEVTDELGDRVERTLLLEAMGRRANLLLLDKNRRITDCLRRVDGDLATGQRQLLPGMFYRMPAPHLGVPPLLGRELVFRGKLATVDEIERLAQDVLEGNATPTVLIRDGKPTDFSFLPILQYGIESELREYDSFSTLLDDFYATRDDGRRMDQRGQDLLKSVVRVRDRTARRVNQQTLERTSTKDRERKRELGDLLTSNLHALQKGMARAVVQDYYDPECPEIEIPLDPLITPQQNAARYYREYNKAKTAETILGELIEKGTQELAYLESVLEAIALAEGERDLQEIREELTQTGYLKRVAKTGNMKIVAKPMEFRTSTGLRVSIGKNNTQNDKLTTKLAGKGDIWLHTQKIHGSHTILWTDGVAPDVQSLTEAASLAAWFSQGREGKKIAVDYTPARYVKKPAGARPGMVIYTTYQTAYVDPDGELVKRLRVK